MIVKHLRSLVIFCDVTIGEIHAVVGTYVAVATAGESGEVTDVGGLVFRDIADTVTFSGDYLDSVLVVGVGRVGFKGGSELTDVFIDVFAMHDACNVKLDIVYTLKALILWPYADVVAFVLNAEVAKKLHMRVVDGLTRGRLLLLNEFILLSADVVRLGQHVRCVGLFVRIETSQAISNQNGGYHEKK